MASMAAWLLSVAADGTRRHQSQRSVCAPPKILAMGGRRHLHLPECVFAHVGEEAAVLGGGIHFCSVWGDRIETACAFMPFLVFSAVTGKSFHVNPVCRLLWMYVGCRKESVTLREKPSALRVTRVSVHEQPLFIFQLYACVYSSDSPHASFVMWLDMWTLQGLDKAQKSKACFHPQQQSEGSCRCLIWHLKKGLVHSKWPKRNLLSCEPPSFEPWFLFSLRSFSPL